MSKYFTGAAGLTLLALTLITGCAPAPALTDQIAFGIWAAEKDLWDEAIFRWKKVLAESPNSVAAHNNLAVAYEKKGFWEDARREYEIALKLAPQNSWLKSNFQKFENNLKPPEKEAEKAQEKKVDKREKI